MCDTLTVSGANDATFNGLYEASDFNVSWAADEEVYQQQDGAKFIFPLNSLTVDEWGIGSSASLTSGNYYYRGNSSNALKLGF